MRLSSDDLDQVASYRQIQDRKKLLKRVVAITQALERMQDSLQAVLIMGASSADVGDIPDKQLQFFQQFRQHMVGHSNTKLQHYLLRLQKLVSQEVRQILRYSEIDPEDAQIDQVVSNEGLRLLKGFQRRAQTAVGLRILLAERGVELPKAVIPVPKRKLRAQLLDLQAKEQKQRLKVERQIIEMQDELKVMLAGQNFSLELKQQFTAVLEGLEGDLQTLRSGVALVGMALSFESVRAEALSVDEVEPVLLEAAKPGHTPGNGPPPPAPVSGWRGFYQRLVRWLNSPWRVSWRQLKDDDDER